MPLAPWFLLCLVLACGGEAVERPAPAYQSFCKQAGDCVWVAADGDAVEDQCIDAHEDAEALAVAARCDREFLDYSTCRSDRTVCPDGDTESNCGTTQGALVECLLDDDTLDGLTAAAWLVCEASYRCEIWTTSDPIEPRVCVEFVQQDFEEATARGCAQSFRRFLSCVFDSTNGCDQGNYYSCDPEAEQYFTCMSDGAYY